MGYSSLYIVRYYDETIIFIRAAIWTVTRL